MELKKVINLEKLLSISGSLCSRTFSTESEHEKNMSDRKYVERRMYSELLDIYKMIEVNRVQIKEPYSVGLYRKITKSGEFNSDILVVPIKDKTVYAQNALAITKKRFYECFEDLHKFISHIILISEYGVFIDGLGHIHYNGKNIKIDPFYKTRSGNIFKNLYYRTDGWFNRLAKKVKTQGQQYDSENIKKLYSHFNRKILPNTNLEYMNLEAKNLLHIRATRKLQKI